MKPQLRQLDTERMNYLEKPVGAGRLEITMRNAVSKKARRVVTTDSELNPLVKTKLIGSSVTMKFLRRQIKDVAATKANVLIVGEPGTGKSTLARMIHEARREFRCSVDRARLGSWRRYGHTGIRIA